MEYRFLKVQNDGRGILTLTVSSPATLNALNSEILSELEDFVDSVSASSARVLVITGEGKAFVAGADISEMAGLDEKGGLAFGKHGARVFRKIELLDIPVIAAVNGFALGGGCELAMSCDIRIASAKASFGQPEVNLGIIPGFSGTYRLSKIAGQAYAKELIFTGRRIKAEEAFRIGLVSRVTEPEALMETAYSIAEEILTSAPLAVSYAKKCLNENYDLDSEGAIELENKWFAKCFATGDQKEGMSAFIDKRAPEFKNR